MIRRLAITAAAAAAVAAAVAVPSGGAPAGDGVVGVRLDEFTLEAGRTEVRAGEVRFASRNEGRLEHELLVVRTDLAPDRIPLGLEGPAVELAGEVVLGHAHDHGDGHAERRHLEPGATRSETVRLTPGRYVLLCSLPGHFEAGQRAALVVR